MNRATKLVTSVADISDIAVARYVATLSVAHCELAYLGLDHEYRINKIGGEAECFGFEDVLHGSLAVEQLAFLEGLLPVDHQTVVIPYVQFMDDRYVDLHLFGEPAQQWLLFVDRSKKGKQLQQVQQIRLNDDVESEQQQVLKRRSEKQVESMDEYFVAIERLVDTYSDASQSVDEKLTDLLQQALHYFDLEVAFLSCVSRDTATLEVVVGEIDTAFKAGDQLPADEVPCSFLVDELSHLAIADLSSSEHKAVSGFTNAGVKSCVAAPVQTINGPFGCVCFYSPVARSNGFSERDEKFLLTVTGFVANLQGNKEQLGFIQAQSSNYKHLFESVPAVMFLCDADGLVISASEMFSQQVGIDQDLVPGKICLDFFDPQFHSDIRKAIRSGDASVVPAILNRIGQYALEVELNVKEKRLGAMAGIRMVIATDVSDRNQALRDLNEQNKLLENANESLDQFAFVASHDLQEPLSKIQQFSSFLEEDLDGILNDDGKYHLDVIVNSTQRMSTLIQDLLKFSRTKKANTDEESVELNGFMDKLVAELDVSIAASEAKIEIGELPTISANIPLLNQLFNNLIGNAIKYHKPDEPPVVRIWAEQLADGMCISVADNGIGFDMQYSQLIFEPFNRLHNSSGYDGSGIGLAICKTVCGKHDWVLDVHSELGIGSTFRVKLNSA